MSFVNDSLEHWEKLADWLNQQLDEQHLTIRGLARKAGIAHSVIAKMTNAQGPYAAKSLNAVADALNVPREIVHTLAGVLPSHGEVLPEARAWSDRLMGLSDENRANAIRAMEGALAAVESAAQSARR